MLVRPSPPQGPATSRGPTVRRAEWSTQQEGVQHHAQVETTHWSAPQHSYGKVVAGVQMRSNGHAVQARRQVEVLSARAPGVTRVLKATITSSSSSSSITQGHHHFDDLQLSVNPLDISSQKERTTVGRSGALGGRRPPTRGRSALPGSQDTSPRDDRSPLERLSSPSIVANGVSKFSRKNENQTSSVDIVEVKSDSDKNSDRSDVQKYKVNFPDNESEDSFYDSCPEKDSIFKDESEQLEEWRRSSKIRRSLQFPKRTIIGKPLLDLPDNWGSVSRIKKELENFHNLSIKYQSPFTPLEKITIKEEESENTNDDINDAQKNYDFLIKPSALKTKSFISLETLNEVRGKLKNLPQEAENKTVVSPQSEKDDGIDTEETSKVEDSPSDVTKKSVKSYVFGMEAMLSSLNDSKFNYPGGTNSLESRTSKLSSSTTKSDDWYMRRKSYGFEKVGQRNETFSLASHLKNNIESSTDSGICRSSELVNSVNSNNLNEQKKNSQRGTIVSIEGTEKRETFEDWLQKNRKSYSTHIQNIGNKYKNLEDSTDDSNKPEIINGQVPMNIPIKPEDPTAEKANFKQLFHRKLTEGTTLAVESTSKEYSTKIDDSLFPSKRHTIAVDGIKEIRDLYEQKADSVSKTFLSGMGTHKTDDIFDEKKNRKVEFCKTEVHFAAESGRVNIVETDEKPPSTNNFRRRRRNSGMTTVKDEDKGKLPMTRFGDNLIAPTVNGNTDKPAMENIKEIPEETNICLSNITQNNSFEETSALVQINGDSDADYRRGILKNKPIKPKPYHLGEDREIKPESDDSSEHNNLWGVKLKPVKDSPLWKSSVLLNRESQSDVENKISREFSALTSIEEVNKINKASLANELADTKNSEAKGYSTKVNIGSGDTTVQTVIHQPDKKQFVNSEDCYIGSYQRMSNTISTSKCVNICDPKRENVTTKICIDVIQPDKNIIQNSKITDSSLYILKSTTLVKDTFSNNKLNNNKNVSNMSLIEKSNDKSQVKTAYKSKLCELRKMYEGREREGSEDSADEEVGRLMGISWSRRRAQRLTNILANSHDNTLCNNSHRSPCRVTENKDGLANSRNVSNSIFKPSDLLPTFNSPKNYLIMERKQNLEKSMNSSVTHLEKQSMKTEDKKSEEIKQESSTFGDTITTPRALLPGRGSARKLKEHELTYFGVKDSKSSDSGSPRTQHAESRFKQSSEINRVQNTETIMQQRYKKDFNASTTNSKQSQFIVTPFKQKEPNGNNYKSDKKLYENVNIQKNTMISNTKAKHPGESIIEELTKAADEILQALNGFSGEESEQNSSDDDVRFRNSGGRSLKPLETIKEGNISKTLENKAVQANLPCREKKISKHSSSMTHKSVKSSSNSSLESVTKEKVSKKSESHKMLENGCPEKPQRKKISSVEAVKARRLQRASSRDALLKVPGSSSEDLAGNTEETLRRKSFRRLKSGEVRRHSSSTSVNTHSSVSVMEEMEANKYNLKSITSALPEIRHKTAISTIKPISEKSKDKSSKSKTNSKERSRRREKSQEATIASMNRSRVLQRERSRSADTSLERVATHARRERIENKDTASYHGDDILETNQLKYMATHHMNGHDKRRYADLQLLNSEPYDSKKKRDPSTQHIEKARDALSSYFKTDETKMRLRDSSLNRIDKTKDKYSNKESSKKERSQLEIGSNSEQSKQKSSRHRESSRDRARTKEPSAHHREKSVDRLKTKQEVEKKHELSKLRKLLGGVKESSSLHTPDKIRPVGSSSSQIRSATHSRTEHD